MVEGLFTGQNYLIGKRMLDMTAMRHEALSANIANVETPGYKRVDIDTNFEAELVKAAQTRDIKRLQALSPSVTVDMTTAAIRPDGNNVSMDRELMEINRNSVEYQFLTQFLSNNLQGIRTAISTNQMN